METVTEEIAIQKALEWTVATAFISESGDNVTAGGAGDVTGFLEKLIQAGLEDTLYAAIADPVAVQQCEVAGPGKTVHLSLGGKLDAINSQPLEIDVEILRVQNGMATVQKDGITIIIVDGRRPFHVFAAFLDSGIDPLSKRLVVVKQGYLAPELREKCSATWMAMSPGFTDLRIEQLPYRRVRRPIYPLDK